MAYKIGTANLKDPANVSRGFFVKDVVSTSSGRRIVLHALPFPFKIPNNKHFVMREIFVVWHLSMNQVCRCGTSIYR